MGFCLVFVELRLLMVLLAMLVPSDSVLRVEIYWERGRECNNFIYQLNLFLNP